MKLSQKAQEVLAFSMGFDPRHKYHFSDCKVERIANLYSIEQITGRKPRGFWYSWGVAWPLYLLSEYVREMGYSQEGKHAMERLEDTNYIYKVSIDYSKVLKIRSKRHFKEFCEKYGCFSNDAPRYFNYPCVINWKKVYRDYWGIDIRFDADMALDCYWYERWDCHSGCIWRREAIKGYKEVWQHKQKLS